MVGFRVSGGAHVARRCPGREALTRCRSDHASFTGAVGEITVNTTTHQLVTHDGVNAGGFAQALAGANTDITSLALNQTGLKIKGASANKLNIKPNETLSAERVLNVTVNDANRALTISGDATVSGNTAVASGTWTPVLTFATRGNLAVVYTIQVGERIIRSEAWCL